MAPIPWAESATCRRLSNKLRGGLSGRHRSSGQAAIAAYYAKRAEGTGASIGGGGDLATQICAALEEEHPHRLVD